MLTPGFRVQNFLEKVDHIIIGWIVVEASISEVQFERRSILRFVDVNGGMSTDRQCYKEGCRC
jgi:hypothetical protein